MFVWFLIGLLESPEGPNFSFGMRLDSQKASWSISLDAYGLSVLHDLTPEGSEQWVLGPHVSQVLGSRILFWG